MHFQSKFAPSISFRSLLNATFQNIEIRTKVWFCQSYQALKTLVQAGQMGACPAPLAKRQAQATGSEAEVPKRSMAALQRTRVARCRHTANYAPTLQPCAIKVSLALDRNCWVCAKWMLHSTATSPFRSSFKAHQRLETGMVTR